MSGMNMEKKADPDARARAHLSNEQTFLSWLRTGFNLIAVGLVILGSIRYREASRQIEDESFQPTLQIATAGTAIAVISGVLALLFVILLYERG